MLILIRFLFIFCPQTISMPFF
ncbi:hypothetical protein KM92DES2_10172 [uncultured Desulfovibrio sp.]|uniref:Uncharacterized protein n=1 Tax=uncultured Desulfovibrio sp. TaxID=167968 RepID=A0A212IWY8_9BACT|nr:hypothetical protein KM92DES2_10172 [uncultured Desulfovibrio sp.]